jgi:hypothetical protein
MMDAANVDRVSQLDAQCRDYQERVTAQAGRILDLETQLATAQKESEMHKLSAQALELQVQMAELEAKRSKMGAGAGATPMSAPAPAQSLSEHVDILRCALEGAGLALVDPQQLKSDQYIWFRSGGAALGIMPKKCAPGVQSFDWITRIDQLTRILLDLKTEWPEGFGDLPPSLENLIRALRDKPVPDPSVAGGSATTSSNPGSPEGLGGEVPSISGISDGSLTMDITEKEEKSDDSKRAEIEESDSGGDK